MRFLAAIRYLRFAPFDTASEDGRSAERYRRAVLAFVANLFGRGLAWVVVMMGVTWTLPYLGTERFGLWMTIASFASMLTFMDIGVSNALANRVTALAAGDDPAGVRQAISGGIGFLAVIGVIAGTAIAVLAALLPWGRLLQSSNPEMTSEARQAAICFGAMFGISILASGIQRVYAGLQRAFEYHAASAVASVLSIAGLWACSAQHAGITALLLVTMGAQLVVALPMLALLVRRRQFAWKDMTLHTFVEARGLIRIGALFLVLQLGVMLGWGADSVIVSSALGVAQVAVYSVAQRLTQTMSIPLALANAPLWAAYSDAHARGDAGFIRKTLRRSLVFTFVGSAVGALLLATFAEPFIARWTDGKVQVPYSTVAIFGVWLVLEALGNSFAMVLNGCGIIKPQVVVVLVFCALVLPMKLALVHVYGIDGVLMATIISYLLAVPLMYATVFRRTIADGLRSAGAASSQQNASRRETSSNSLPPL